MIERLEFRIPWILPSKKNRTFVAPGSRRPTPDHVIVAHEDAIRALALAELGRLLDLVSDNEAERIGAMARERVRKRSGVGTKTLQAYLDDLPSRLRAVFGKRDVGVDVLEEIGPDSARDATVVTIDDLGPPPPRLRAGPRHDLSNVPAVVLDALEGVAYEDDCQVVRLFASRSYTEPPRA